MGNRRIASAARIKAAALAHRTVLNFVEGGTLVLRGASPHDEESARAAQQGDLSDLIEGRVLLEDYGLLGTDGMPSDVNGLMGLSSMIYAANLASICAVSLVEVEGEDGFPLPASTIGLFAMMMADSDATRQITDWALAPPAFWSDEGNVLGSPSSVSGQVAPSPNQPTPINPEQVSASAS
jgi:hypothetical protein